MDQVVIPGGKTDGTLVLILANKQDLATAKQQDDSQFSPPFTKLDTGRARDALPLSGDGPVLAKKGHRKLNKYMYEGVGSN